MDGGGIKNPRGWTAITICGRDVAMVPTNRAIQQIEVRLNIGMPGLIARFFNGDVRVRDINVVVEECLRGGGYVGKDGGGAMFSYEEIGEDILARFSEYAATLGVLLAQVFGPALPKDAPPPSAAERPSP
jgi:hypothetical protein